MASSLLTFRGETDGSSTSGTFKLYSDLLYEPVDYIRIPKGMKAKVWCKRISGEEATTIHVEFANDVTAGTPTWSKVSTEYLASPGEVTLEKRRPVVLHGKTGKEAIRVTWSQATAGKAYVEIEVELTDE